MPKKYDKIKFSIEKEIPEELKNLKPIFIIGLPRSGSTLVESLISQCTDQIYSFGELHAINMSIFDTIAFDIYSENFNYENFNFVINQEKFQNSLLERYGILKDKVFIDKSLENFFNIDIILNFFPGLSSVPANIDPIIIASAPAANAFAISPENLIPPSEIILIFFLFNAFLTSMIAVIWGTPIPATILVVQIEPGPIPTFIISAPELYNFLAASPVAIFPTHIVI